jgi:hypothetical protein
MDQECEMYEDTTRALLGALTPLTLLDDSPSLWWLQGSSLASHGLTNNNGAVGL